MRLIQFGKIPLNQQDGEHALPVTGRSALVDLPNGAFDQDSDKVYLKSNQISYRGLFTETLDFSMNMFLTELAKGRNILKAVLRDGVTYWNTYGKMLTVTRVARARDWDCEQPVQATFVQDFPFWMLDNDGLVS